MSEDLELNSRSWKTVLVLKSMREAMAETRPTTAAASAVENTVELPREYSVAPNQY